MWFWWSTPPTPDKIYASNLEILRFGRPLWIPEPHKSGEPQIGDVGFEFRGQFIRLFHLDPSIHEKQVTCWTPAFDFTASKPFPKAALSIFCTDHWIARGHYFSRGVRHNSIHASAGSMALPVVSGAVHASYTCKETYGAALTLQSSADLEDTIPSRFLKQYILQHHHHWYEYATEALGYDLKPENILVVSGSVKTSHDWAATTFGAGSSTDVAASVDASAAGTAHANVGGSHSTSTTTSSIWRQGSAYSTDVHAPIVGTGPRDQCIFFNRLRVRRQLGFLSRMVAGAGPSHFRKEDQQHASSSMLAMMDEQEDSHDEDLMQTTEEKAYDLLDILLLYILETTGASVAIASDDEVTSLIGNTNVEDFYSYLLRHSPVRVEITDSCAQLCTEDLIRHQQEQRFAHPLITDTDITEWPQITRKDAGSLTSSGISLGPTQSKTRPVEYKAVVFGDSERTSITHRDCISLSTNGKLLAAAVGASIVVWRLCDGLTVQRLGRDGQTSTIRKTHTIRQIAFSRDDQHVVSGADNKLALVWNVNTGDVVHRLVGHESAVLYAAFSPDGTQIATRSMDSLRIWYTSSGGLLHVITDLKSEGSTNILFSPDGSRLAARTDASDGDTAVEILNCHTGERIATLRKQKICCVSFSPSSDRIATGSRDGSASVWHTASSKVLLELQEHENYVNEVAFSPDGGEVATASDDGTVVTCDSRTGERRFTFRESVQGRNKKWVHTVAYSPGNSFIACGAHDGCVRVWNRKTGALVATFQGHTEAVDRVMFTPDGRDVLSYGRDHVVRLWSIRDALRLA